LGSRAIDAKTHPHSIQDFTGDSELRGRDIEICMQGLLVLFVILLPIVLSIQLQKKEELSLSL
jgi:hypothetical protein